MCSGLHAHTPLQTLNFCPTQIYCWPIVYDVGPTVKQRWANVSWLLKRTDRLRWLRLQVEVTLKVIYHPLYSMKKILTNKSKLPQDGPQVFPYMGWLAIM